MARLTNMEVGKSDLHFHLFIFTNNEIFFHVLLIIFLEFAHPILVCLAGQAKVNFDEQILQKFTQLVLNG